MTEITSPRNPRVRAAAALARRRERRERRRHLVEGPNAVAEALAAGVVETLFTTPEARPRAVPGDVEVVVVAAPVLAQLAGTTTPQGVVAVARDVAVAVSALPAAGLVVVLDGLADPGNVGTIVRTADAAGAAGVVCTTGTADVQGPKAVRAAAGSTYHLPVVVDADEADLDRLAAGRRLLGLTADGATSVLAVDARRPLALVLGNEAHGLADAIRARLDGTVHVPMPGAAESLNVAAAAAVAIYALGVAWDRPAPPRRGEAGGR